MRKRFGIALMVCLAGGALLSCKEWAGGGSVGANPAVRTQRLLAFSTNWDAALKEARTSGKPIFLFFGGPW